MARNKSKRNVMKMWRQLPPWAWRLALYKVKDLDSAPEEVRNYQGTDMEYRDTFEDANVVTSESSRTQWTNKHRPVLDLDFPAALIPSTTKGHFHLFLDKELEWDKYEALLKAMAAAGLLEQGYVDSSIQRKRTTVRLPWQRKVRHDYDKPIGPEDNREDLTVSEREFIVDDMPEGYTRTPTLFAFAEPAVFQLSPYFAWNGTNIYLTTPVEQANYGSSMPQRFRRQPLVLQDFDRNDTASADALHVLRSGLVNARIQINTLSDSRVNVVLYPHLEVSNGDLLVRALNRHTGMHSGMIYADARRFINPGLRSPRRTRVRDSNLDYPHNVRVANARESERDNYTLAPEFWVDTNTPYNINNPDHIINAINTRSWRSSS